MDSTTPLTFSNFLRHADYSLLQSHNADPEQIRHVPNKRMREVKSGHYVEVEPTLRTEPKILV